MAPSVCQRAAREQVLFQTALPRQRPRMAKADVSILDITPDRRAVGLCFRRALNGSHLTDDEAAGRLGVHAAELHKWTTGERRLHVDRIRAVPEIAGPFAIELAKFLSPDVEVCTEIRLRAVAHGGFR